jgi:hypothetical protein
MAPLELVILGERDSRSCVIKDDSSSRSKSFLMTLTHLAIPTNHPWTDS